MKTFIIILIILALSNALLADNYRSQYLEQSEMRYQLLEGIEMATGCYAPTQREVIQCLDDLNN